MRRKSLVAGAVLTAVLALGALPDVSRSISPIPVRPLPADAFQSVRLSAFEEGATIVVGPLDATDESASHLDLDATLIEPGSYELPTERPLVTQPDPDVLVTPIVAPKPVAAPKKAAPKVPATRKTAPKVTPARPRVVTPPKKARTVLHGLASWYDNGTTAMRLPSGTHIKVCGEVRCVTRVVSDWGPASWLGNRIVDLTPADFRAITGESLGTGLAKVTVYIY